MASSDPVVHADGRIGSLQIDVTTEAQLRAAVGVPYKIELERTPGYRGRYLYYRCGRGCATVYSIRDSTRALSDFSTQSRRFVTEHGSRVGMTVAHAAALERGRIVPGCGYPRYIHVRWDAHHAFVLAIYHGKVDSIIYLGPHSIYYDGLC